jgi:hypothetical protein
MEAVGISVPIDKHGIVSGCPKGLRTYCSRDKNPFALAISLNLHRRHLTAEQKRDIIARLLKEDPAQSDRKIGNMVKADHKTVGAVRAEAEARGEIPHVETRKDAAGRAQPARRPKAAKVEAKPANPTVTTGVVLSEKCKDRMRQQAANLFNKTGAVISAEQRKAEYAADEAADEDELSDQDKREVWLLDLMARASEAAAAAYIRKDDCVGFKVTRQALASARGAADSWAATLAFLETLPVMEDAP